MEIIRLQFNYRIMTEKEMPSNEESFWLKYKSFASTEILMYLIMIIGIFLGLIILL